MNIVNSEQNIKCLKHQKKDIEFLQVNELNNQNMFYCSACINEDLSFKGINCVLIQQIIDQGQTQIIQKWPPTNDYNIVKKLIEVSSTDTQSFLIAEITNYFSNLREDILKKLEICQKNVINKAIELSLNREQINEKYQQISSIKELRQFLLQLNEDTLTQQQEFQSFLFQIESEKDRNTQQLQSLLTKCQNDQNLINFNYPNAIKETILSYFDEMNFFNLKLNENNQQQEDNILDKVDIVMNLISNKSNYCSDSFISSLKEQIRILNPIFEQLSSFDTIFLDGKKPIDFSQINMDQLDQIGEYANHLTLLKNSSYNEDGNQDQQSSFKITELNNIIRNKLNFTSPYFNQQFEKFLINQSPFLDKLEFDNTFNDRNKFDYFRDLSDDIIKDMFLLTQKRQELERDNKYQISQTSIIQFNQEISTIYKKEEIETIIRKYPIFDLCQSAFLLNIQLQKTQFNQGNNRMIINKNALNQYEVQSKLNDITGLNCISDLILEKDKKYIFRMKIESFDTENKTFYIGLIPQNCWGYGFDQHLCCKFKYGNDVIEREGQCFGIDKQIKGDRFSLPGNSIIEMRVCLKDQVLEILDYPNYNFKLGLTDNYKQNLIQKQNLQLYISIHYLQMKLTLISTHIVNDFLD